MKGETDFEANSGLNTFEVTSDRKLDSWVSARIKVADQENAIMVDKP